LITVAITTCNRLIIDLGNLPDMEYKTSTLIAENMSLSEDEAQLIDELIPVKEFSKGTILLEEGRIAKDCYFTIKGCVRSYYLVDGEERTTSFFVEEEAITSLTSYVQRKPANHYFSCVEDSVLAVLNYDKEKELYKSFPQLETLCRLSIEQEYGKQQEILANYLTKNPEERYLLLMKTKPELLQRVPQYHLASYLGVQPESLSRIRKRIAHKM